MQTRIILILACLLAATASLARASTRGPGTIVAAFYPIAYAAEQIAPPGTKVKNLTPAGAEPHDIELTPSDVAAMTSPPSCSTWGRASSPRSRRR